MAGSEQLRLALVMNGGVSLAVWMSGATHEVNNCRLARPGDDTAARSRRAWAAILERAGTAVVVDLVAGTSAGGLNGTVLAKAVARGEDLPDLRSLWLDRATISAGKLLSEKPEPAASLLNGVYFFEQIVELLDTSSPTADDQVTTPSVSLLVTATALPIADEQDSVAEVVRDSRRVYRFVARPAVPAGDHGIAELPAMPATNDFDSPDKLEVLARAARASAAFPTAFQPVSETEQLREHRTGQLASRGGWLMDGGVLDNAPFEPLLDELRHRAVSDRFHRAVVYINPSAPPVRRATFDRNLRGDNAPGILTTLTAFVSATREPDRRLDVEGLDQALNAMGFSSTDPDHIFAELFDPNGRCAMTPDGLEDAATALFPQYRANRRQALFLSARGSATLKPAPSAPTDDTPDSALLVPAHRGFPADAGWSWGLAAADRVLRWWGRALAEQEASNRLPAAFADLGPAQRRVQVWAEGFDAAVRQHRGHTTEWITAAEAYLTAHDLPRLVARLLRAVGDEVAPALHAPSGAELLDATLDLEVVNRALSWRAETATDVPTFDSWQITPGATRPFPLDLTEQEEVDWPRSKLYGERWGHFGAFASEEGRAWDWLWGRLDAATTLARQILGDEDAPDLLAELITAICAEEQTTQTEVARTAKQVVALTQGALWVAFRGAATDATRAALGVLADKLPGSLVPRRWPAPVHAIVDTEPTWIEHRPPFGARRLRAAPYRLLGLGAQRVARRKIAQLISPPD